MDFGIGWIRIQPVSLKLVFRVLPYLLKNIILLVICILCFICLCKLRRCRLTKWNDDFCCDVWLYLMFIISSEMLSRVFWCLINHKRSKETSRWKIPDPTWIQQICYISGGSGSRCIAPLFVCESVLMRCVEARCSWRTVWENQFRINAWPSDYTQRSHVRPQRHWRAPAGMSHLYQPLSVFKCY